MMRFLFVAALALTASTPVLARQSEPVVQVRLDPDLEHPGTEFEGWGTALAWFANLTGGWPNGERERLADLLYGENGLGWTIARYNIGGGAREDATPLTQPGANVPGFWHLPAGTSGDEWRADDPAMWDWSADANQRWWLVAIKVRVENPIFEAFSNSPPWFMTVSGEVSGASDATDDNLLPGKEDEFAVYLATAVEELQKRHGIVFRTLSPVNEPGTNYWYAGNRQEGAHWSATRQATMFVASDKALKERGLSTVVSGPDETSSELFIEDVTQYPPSTFDHIGQLNVHSYGNLHQSAVRDFARSRNIRLWMSEVDRPRPGDPENFDGMASPLAFAEHVVADLKRLEPSAWVFWQAVETFSASDGRDGSNWGLVKADLRASPDHPHRMTVTRKYWAMAQFSRFIRPGFRLVPIADTDTVAAVSPDGTRVVLVHVNAGPVARELDLPKGWESAMVVTDMGRDAQCVSGGRVPPYSVATIVLEQRQRPELC